MKKAVVAALSLAMVLGVTACGAESTDIPSSAEIIEVEDDNSETEESSEEETPGKSEDKSEDEAKEPEAIQEESEGTISAEQAYEAIGNYIRGIIPDIDNYTQGEDAMAYWTVTSSDADQIVVEFRSYTGAFNYFYIDPATGDTYVTELVPGIIDEEQRTEETFNVKDFLK